MSGKVVARIRDVGAEAVCISIITSAELRFGAARRALPRLSRAIDQILGELEILPLAVPTDAHYADIRNAFEKAGRLIGPNDLLIAAHARALGYVLLTANAREFNRVRDLNVENWIG